MGMKGWAGEEETPLSEGWGRGLRGAGRPVGAPRSRRKGRGGDSGRAVQTEGGQGGGPTRTWRGGCHRRSPWGRGRSSSLAHPAELLLSPPAPRSRRPVRPRGPVGAAPWSAVGGSGGPRCVPASGPLGVPRPRAPLCFPGPGTREAPRSRPRRLLRSR